jgi:hypothetical protein
LEKFGVKNKDFRKRDSNSSTFGESVRFPEPVVYYNSEAARVSILDVG